MVMPTIRKLQDELDFEFLVIANRDPTLDLPHYRFIKWKQETEVEDLAQIDIGIMPLEDNEWAKGKCGFKLIQYGALEIPAVASPVGVNKDIIQHNVNGFLANSSDSWKKYMEMLIKDAALRNKLGRKARRVIVERYSTEAVKEKFLGLFE
jgi:glycosyltransferase involved in cell wall biosynthesis